MEEKTYPEFDRASAIGEVILAARRVEERLHLAAGGEVTGIHALTELLGDKLPEDLKRRLHYVATIRNRAAHEAEFEITAAEFASFQQAATEALDTLTRLFPDAGSAPAPESADAPLDVAVEKAGLQKLAHRLHVMGFFPLIGALNLLRLLISCIWEQLGIVALVLFYLAAIPMLAEGIRTWPEKSDLFYTGGAVAAAVCVITVIVSFFQPVAKLPKVIVWLPGINVIYLLALFAKRLAWGKLLLSAAGLAALVTSAYGALNERWELAGYALLAEWVLSILASCLFPPPRTEEK